MLTLAKYEGSGAQVKHFSNFHTLMYLFSKFHDTSAFSVLNNLWAPWKGPSWIELRIHFVFFGKVICYSTLRPWVGSFILTDVS